MCIGGFAVVMGVSDWDLFGLSPLVGALKGDAGSVSGPFRAASTGAHPLTSTWLHTSSKSIESKSEQKTFAGWKQGNTPSRVSEPLPLAGASFCLISHSLSD